MIEGLGTGIRASYRNSRVLFTNTAWLWIGVAAFELLQHGVEWNLGIFTPDGDIETTMESRAFWIAAYAKTGAVLVCAYLVPRYISPLTRLPSVPLPFWR